MDKLYELMDDLQKTIAEIQKVLDEVDKDLGNLQYNLNEALEENQMLRDNEDYEEPIDRSDFI